MGHFADYLSRKMEQTVTKEEHPSVLVSGAIEEARELGQSIAGMLGDHSRREKLKRMNLKFRGS